MIAWEWVLGSVMPCLKFNVLLVLALIVVTVCTSGLMQNEEDIV